MIKHCFASEPIYFYTKSVRFPFFFWTNRFFIFPFRKCFFQTFFFFLMTKSLRALTNGESPSVHIIFIYGDVKWRKMEHPVYDLNFDYIFGLVKHIKNSSLVIVYISRQFHYMLHNSINRIQFFHYIRKFISASAFLKGIAINFIVDWERVLHITQR